MTVRQGYALAIFVNALGFALNAFVVIDDSTRWFNAACMGANFALLPLLFILLSAERG